MTKEEWYSKRNSRINIIDGVSLDHSKVPSVNIIVGNDCINSYSGQVMLLVTINILTRWCNSCVIYLSQDTACVIPNNQSISLKDQIEKILKDNDPFGNFLFSNENPWNNELILCIGNPNIKAEKPYYWIEANNWVSGFGYGSYSELKIKPNEDHNPIGASFAACLVMSVIFERFNKMEEQLPFSKYYSLYDFKSSQNPELLSNPEISTRLDIGRTFQIGCGAVGSSFDFLLSLMNVSGIIHLIDYDSIEVENLCSSLLFDANDAFDKKKKIDACNFCIEKVPDLDTKIHDCDYGEFINNSNYLDNYPDLILCFANEKNIWSTIQFNLPPIVFHATTTPNWSINFGRHIPMQEWCIVCRFGTEEYKHTPICSNVKISSDSSDKEIFGVLPFLSPAAAILTLAELIKLKNYPEYPINSNFIQFMVKGCTEFRLLQMGKKESCPVCSTQELNDYPDKIKFLFL